MFITSAPSCRRGWPRFALGHMDWAWSSGPEGTWRWFWRAYSRLRRDPDLLCALIVRRLYHTATCGAGPGPSDWESNGAAAGGSRLGVVQGRTRSQPELTAARGGYLDGSRIAAVARTPRGPRPSSSIRGISMGTSISTTALAAAPKEKRPSGAPPPRTYSLSQLEPAHHFEAGSVAGHQSLAPPPARQLSRRGSAAIPSLMLTHLRRGPMPRIGPTADVLGEAVFPAGSLLPPPKQALSARPGSQTVKRSFRARGLEAQLAYGKARPPIARDASDPQLVGPSPVARRIRPNTLGDRLLNLGGVRTGSRRGAVEEGNKGQAQRALSPGRGAPQPPVAPSPSIERLRVAQTGLLSSFVAAGGAVVSGGEASRRGLVGSSSQRFGRGAITSSFRGSFRDSFRGSFRGGVPDAGGGSVRGGSSFRRGGPPVPFAATAPDAGLGASVSATRISEAATARRQGKASVASTLDSPAGTPGAAGGGRAGPVKAASSEELASRVSPASLRYSKLGGASTSMKRSAPLLPMLPSAPQQPERLMASSATSLFSEAAGAYEHPLLIRARLGKLSAVEEMRTVRRRRSVAAGAAPATAAEQESQNPSATPADAAIQPAGSPGKRQSLPMEVMGANASDRVSALALIVAQKQKRRLSDSGLLMKRVDSRNKGLSSAEEPASATAAAVSEAPAADGAEAVVAGTAEESVATARDDGSVPPGWGAPKQDDTTSSEEAVAAPAAAVAAAATILPVSAHAGSATAEDPAPAVLSLQPAVSEVKFASASPLLGDESPPPPGTLRRRQQQGSDSPTPPPAPSAGLRRQGSNIWGAAPPLSSRLGPLTRSQSTVDVSSARGRYQLATARSFRSRVTEADTLMSDTGGPAAASPRRLVGSTTPRTKGPPPRSKSVRATVRELESLAAAAASTGTSAGGLAAPVRVVGRLKSQRLISEPPRAVSISDIGVTTAESPSAATATPRGAVTPRGSLITPRRGVSSRANLASARSVTSSLASAGNLAEAALPGLRRTLTISTLGGGDAASGPLGIPSRMLSKRRSEPTDDGTPRPLRNTWADPARSAKIIGRATSMRLAPGEGPRLVDASFMRSSDTGHASVRRRWVGESEQGVLPRGGGAAASSAAASTPSQRQMRSARMAFREHAAAEEAQRGVARRGRNRRGAALVYGETPERIEEVYQANLQLARHQKGLRVVRRGERVVSPSASAVPRVLLRPRSGWAWRM